MELEPDSVALLESGKFYHVNFAHQPSPEALKSFCDRLTTFGIRAVITLGEVSVTDLCVLFSGMLADDRSQILASLNYVNPVEHEQSK